VQMLGTTQRAIRVWAALLGERWLVTFRPPRFIPRSASEHPGYSTRERSTVTPGRDDEGHAQTRRTHQAHRPVPSRVGGRGKIQAEPEEPTPEPTWKPSTKSTECGG
jgi:hypothetical protein